MRLDKKQILAQKRRWRVRQRVRGTQARPRLCVTFTHQHIYAQCINDEAGVTLVGASTLTKDAAALKPNKPGAEALGRMLGQKIKAAGIQAVVFDRRDRSYHGTVQAFADAVRQEGVSF
jgi:large subunit ribosomal protein L18